MNAKSEILGDRLKKFRVNKELTQKQFVEGLSINSATLSAYEKGTTNPSIVVIIEIAEKYNISIDWLTGLTDNPGGNLGKEAANKDNSENKFETLTEIGNLLIALVNSDIAKNCADGTNDTFSGNKNKIDIKLAISEFKTGYTGNQVIDNIITFRSESKEFNSFFADIYKLKDVTDRGTLDKAYFDVSIKKNLEKLKGITIKSLLKDDDLPF